MLVFVKRSKECIKTYPPVEAVPAGAVPVGAAVPGALPAGALG